MTTHLRRNAVAILLDFAGFGTALGFMGYNTLLPLLAFTLTQNEALVGLVGTLWTGMWLLPQMAAGRWMSRRPRKKPVLIGGALLSRLAFGLLVVMLAAGRALDPFTAFAGVVILIALFRGLDAVAAVAWFDVVSKVLPTTVRGRIFGLGQALANVLRFGASLVVTAAIAGGLKYPDSFITLYGFAALSLGLSFFALLFLREPIEDNSKPLAGQLSFLAHTLHVLRTDPRFRQMTIARLLVGLFELAGPQYVVHATKELGLADSIIGLFLAAQTVGGVLASIALGGLSGRKGAASVIRVGTILAASVPLLALLLHLLGHNQPGPAAVGYVLLYGLSGALDASYMLGYLDYTMAIAPPGERATYTGLANTIGGLVVVAPTIGGVILRFTSYPVLFACAAVGAGLGLLAALRLPAAWSAAEPAVSETVGVETAQA
ncbi:MAG TPA: MFS transporter [Anaerolineae bacterium]|nr:MFS transporter [Anaerolineae bacterium]